MRMHVILREPSGDRRIWLGSSRPAPSLRSE
jgi:hypothetical protein